MASPIGDVQGQGRLVGQPSRSTGSTGTFADLLYLVRRDYTPVPDAARFARLVARVRAYDAWLLSPLTGSIDLSAQPVFVWDDLLELAARVAVVHDRGLEVPVVGLGFKLFPGQVTDPLKPWVGSTHDTTTRLSVTERSGSDGPWWVLRPGRWWEGQAADTVPEGYVEVLLDDGSTLRFRWSQPMHSHPLSVLGWAVVPWPRSKVIFDDIVAGVGKVVKLAGSLADGSLDIADVGAAVEVVQAAVAVGGGGAPVDVDPQQWEVVWGSLVKSLTVWLTQAPDLSLGQIATALRALSAAYPPLAPRFDAVARVCEQFSQPNP